MRHWSKFWLMILGWVIFDVIVISIRWVEAR